MAKNKRTIPTTGRMEPRMWRVNQRSVKFTPATSYDRNDKSWEDWEDYA